MYCSGEEACYKAMVRPILEHSSTVWSPFTKKNITMIEAVQRQAARFVTNIIMTKQAVSLLCY